MNDGRQNLVPIPQEKRESLLLNVDNESAESLNMEVLPILNEVLISNRFQHEIPLQENHRRLRISEWNAERGLDWDILPSFYSNSDIIILNEMDWGMARSGNKDTAQQMSESLEMNYAYGVEFLELTNGNEKEINATIDQKNHIGYHGNAILSKWKILQSKIVRLHPLYELLYEEKASGQAKGERRLGGRMALFASIETDVGVILVISMHAHSGSKRNLLRSDAVLVCDEISKWNITNVIIGGDIASPIPKWLVSGCGFWALDKTNSQKKNGGGLMPSWKVECPRGAAPSVGKFPMRGDWILAKGSGFKMDTNVSTDTVYTYRMNSSEDGKEVYECISDHALLTFEVNFSDKVIV